MSVADHWQSLVLNREFGELIDAVGQFWYQNVEAVTQKHQLGIIAHKRACCAKMDYVR